MSKQCSMASYSKDFIYVPCLPPVGGFASINKKNDEKHKENRRLQDLLVAELACSLCRLFWSIWRKWNSANKLNMSKGNKVMLVVDIRWAEMCVNWYWLEVLCAWLKIENSESKTQKTCPAVRPSPCCQHGLTARRLCMCVGGGTGQEAQDRFSS